jgi:Arc/MetJ-type ribon-helix-helix transcriptional regulator
LAEIDNVKGSDRDLIGSNQESTPMSKTITISDEVAERLERLVEDGRYADLDKAADELLDEATAWEFDPEFLAGLEEAIREIDAGHGVPLTRDLLHKIFEDARAEVAAKQS